MCFKTVINKKEEKFGRGNGICSVGCVCCNVINKKKQQNKIKSPFQPGSDS